jgi:hypothetical protein
VALGQPQPIAADDEWNVHELRGRQLQRPVEQQLARRARQQIVGAHHFGHALGCVVDDDRELVGGPPIALLDHEVPGDAALLRPREVIDERRMRDVDAEPQRRFAARGLARSREVGEPTAAGARIHRTVVVALVRRRRRLFDLAPRAHTRVGGTRRHQA